MDIAHEKTLKIPVDFIKIYICLYFYGLIIRIFVFFVETKPNYWN